MNADELKEYRQDFTVAILYTVDGPLTAGDVAEHLAVLAAAEGHPPECWRSADPTTMAGHLRALEARHVVHKVGIRADGRAGRQVPTWALTDAWRERAAPRIPMPPTGNEPAVATAAPREEEPNPYADLSRSELYALLKVHDKISGACRRFLRDMEELSEEARRELTAAGLKVPSA